MEAQPITIPVGDGSVSGLMLRPPGAKALYLFAHGAGVGMAHPSMETNAHGFAERGIATLRYQFPYMERVSGRPVPQSIAHGAVCAAAAVALETAGDLVLFAGGRSYGGRMTSQAQAASPIPGMRGLVFLGFPLHPAGAPATDRADHLADVQIPMLFVSGDRDALAETSLLKATVESLGERATLCMIEDGDHSLKIRAKSGRSSADAQAEAMDCIAAWIAERT
jgi:predicted alpha/beta-hydrolase family hydrolase